MITYIAINSPSAIDGEQILRMARKLIRFLPIEFAEEQPIIISSTDGKAHFVYWLIEHSVGSAVHVGREFVNVIQGYTTRVNHHDADAVSLALKDGDFIESPGGIYTLLTFNLQSGGFTGVQSKSGVTSLFFSKNKGLSVLSDRPILAHMFSRERMEMERGHIPSIIQSMFSINNTTPYVGTVKLPCTEFVSLRNGLLLRNQRRSFSPFVIRSEEKSRIEDFQKILLESFPHGFSETNPTLRISGGKDSRLLLALFSYLKVDATIENQNLPFSSEGQIAHMVAAAAGYDLTLSAPVASDDVTHSFLDGYVLRGGQLNPVPLHYPYENTIVKPRECLVLGHAHHPRGGFARTMHAPLENVKKRLLDSFARSLVKPELDENSEIILDYISNLKVDHPLHILYYAYSDLRVPNYLSIHYLEYQSRSIPVYPLIDERVILYLDSLIQEKEGAYQIVGETLFFSAIKGFSPDLANLPLDNKRWRFEVSVPKQGFEEGFWERGQYPSHLPMSDWEKSARDFYLSRSRAAEKIVYHTVLSNLEFFEDFLNISTIKSIKDGVVNKETVYALYGIYMSYTLGQSVFG